MVVVIIWSNRKARRWKYATLANTSNEPITASTTTTQKILANLLVPPSLLSFQNSFVPGLLSQPKKARYGIFWEGCKEKKRRLLIFGSSQFRSIVLTLPPSWKGDTCRSSRTCKFSLPSRTTTNILCALYWVSQLKAPTKLIFSPNTSRDH